ncbi:hypothetical protein WT25_26305 [Burkholderia territorii]|nr:hypothetical protein WT25_26305 [Burkholderia territorii]
MPNSIVQTLSNPKAVGVVSVVPRIEQLLSTLLDEYLSVFVNVRDAQLNLVMQGVQIVDDARCITSESVRIDVLLNQSVVGNQYCGVSPDQVGRKLDKRLANHCISKPFLSWAALERGFAET